MKERRIGIIAIFMVLLMPLAFAEYGDVDVDAGDTNVAVDSDGTVGVNAGGNTVAVDSDGTVGVNAAGNTVAVDSDGTVGVNAAGNTVGVSSDGSVAVNAGQTTVRTSAGNVYSQAVRVRFSEQELGELESVFTDEELADLETVFTEDELDDFKKIALTDNVDVTGSTVNLQITPGEISVNNMKIKENKKIKVNNVDIEADGTKVSLKDGKYHIKTQGVIVTNNQIRVGNVNIKMPSEIIDETDDVSNIEIVEEDGMVLYTMQQNKNKKLLGMFSVSVSEDVKIEAQNGTVIDVSGPWWNFMAFG